MSRIKTYCEQAINHIKCKLLDGSLRPGDQIREHEIAADLGISRGPVREALLSLLAQGLVTGLPQKAKFIRSMDPKEIEDSYNVGGTLEGACIVQSLERWDNAARIRAVRILDEMCRQSTLATGLAAMSQIDETFHDHLLSKCDNRLMVELARSSCAHISKFLYYREWDHLYSPQEFYQRHHAILDAVDSGDGALIQKTLLEHYAESGRRLAHVCSGKARADDEPGMARGDGRKTLFQ